MANSLLGVVPVFDISCARKSGFRVQGPGTAAPQVDFLVVVVVAEEESLVTGASIILITMIMT